MLTFQESISIIIVVALVTYLTRALPFILFKSKEPPKKIILLGKILPFSIIAILVVYALKDVQWKIYPHGLPEVLALAFTAALHWWKQNNMISIGGGTILYMILIQVVFA